jgi:hypothetical protein
MKAIQTCGLAENVARAAPVGEILGSSETAGVGRGLKPEKFVPSVDASQLKLS